MHDDGAFDNSVHYCSLYIFLLLSIPRSIFCLFPLFRLLLELLDKLVIILPDLLLHEIKVRVVGNRAHALLVGVVLPTPVDVDGDGGLVPWLPIRILVLVGLQPVYHAEHILTLVDSSQQALVRLVLAELPCLLEIVVIHKS